ncbi:MAG: hypothetical protein M0R17_01165 [Candidatus Omnitrophica bacterium]|jgi:hypothetical protein|nr:hypothetical protein [Candidatus Omnitrophota bacterium]
MIRGIKILDESCTSLLFKYKFGFDLLNHTLGYQTWGHTVKCGEWGFHAMARDVSNYYLYKKISSKIKNRAFIVEMTDALDYDYDLKIMATSYIKFIYEFEPSCLLDKAIFNKICDKFNVISSKDFPTKGIM